MVNVDETSCILINWKYQSGMNIGIHILNIHFLYKINNEYRNVIVCIYTNITNVAKI